MSDPKITVEHRSDVEFLVTIVEGGSQTTHVVTVDTQREDVSNEGLVAAAFRFLLDREPKESILPAFDLSDIERYFPEFGERIDDYL